MVRKETINVPERYIQEPKDRPQHSSFCEAAFKVPMINFSLLASGDEDERKKLDLACREWGFFQMINHGVAVEVLRKMKAAVAAFFDLSLEEKQKYAMADNDVQGYGQAYVVSEHQKLGFREAADGYAAELCKLNEVTFANLSILMGLEKDGLKKLHLEMNQGIRMNYYSPCSRPDVVLGVSPHSDGGTITFPIQDDEISGLQIRHNGCWVPVKPIPNAVVVNVGDALEAWSNGLYKSIEHRAVTNETVARMSIATFMVPDGEVEIGPVETMVGNLNRPRMYKNIKFINYVKHTLSKRMEGKANIELLKFQEESN